MPGASGGRLPHPLPLLPNRPPTASIANPAPALALRLQLEAPDPGMQPKRFTHARSPGDADLCLGGPAAIVGAQPGTGHADRLRPRAVPLNPLQPEYQWCPVSSAPPLAACWEGGDSGQAYS